MGYLDEMVRYCEIGLLRQISVNAPRVFKIVCEPDI